jgi:hypothetical protein
MDDHTTSPPMPWTVSRYCEVSRLQRQLLARAYQHVFPEVRRPLVDSRIKPPAANSFRVPSTSARMAAGA